MVKTTTKNERKLQIIDGTTDTLLKLTTDLLSKARHENVRMLLVSSDKNANKTLSDRFPKRLRSIAPNQTTQLLGQECDLILFDATKGFAVNAFASISGCLVGGGLMILIQPNSDRLQKGTIAHQLYSGSACLNRLLKLGCVPTLLPTNTCADPIRRRQSLDNLSAAAQQQQAKLIAQIKRCATGHAKRPLVISADRGRGKSASLGIACAELVVEKRKTILITSTRRTNLDVFFRHYQQHLSLLLSQNKNARHLTGDQFMQFLAPDEMAQIEPCHQLLIVEEAASIPVQLLQKICDKSNRLIFSTTIHGYEGNGQGFNLRFLPFLRQKFSQIYHAELNLPIRWSLDDPLEGIINQAFLQSFSKPSLTDRDHADKETFPLTNVQYRLITQQELNHNESLLVSLFELLVTAHYQTRPSDLEALLSDPNWMVFAAYDQDQLLAASIVCREGQIDHHINAQIEQGKKRLKGHLLPQSLMAYQGIQQAGLALYWRVIRIAVQPQLRRQKIASKLIAFIKVQATQQGIEQLGSSFAMSSDVLLFWYHCGFSCVRIALTKDSSSGAYPCEFLTPCRDKKSDILQTACNQFNQSFLYNLGSQNRLSDPNLMLIILENQIVDSFDAIPTSTPTTRNHSYKEVQRYLEQARSFEMVEWHLYHFVVEHWLTLNSAHQLASQEKLLLLVKLFQHRSWDFVSHYFSKLGTNAYGKNAFKKQLRQVIKRIISQD